MLSQSDQVRDAVNAMTDGKFILLFYYFIILLFLLIPVWAIVLTSCFVYSRYSSSRASEAGRRVRGVPAFHPGRRVTLHRGCDARTGARRYRPIKRGSCEALRAVGQGSRSNQGCRRRRLGPRPGAAVADVSLPRRRHRVPRHEHRVPHAGERHGARELHRMAP